MTLHEFFTQNPKAALAFSGGADSAYLLYAAVREGADVCAYYVRSAFQPQFELDDARRLAEDLHVRLKILSVDVLCSPDISSNPPDRCYHCKKAIFSAILREAREDGYTVLLDGTNMSDDTAERPGMRVLTELSVYSPLRQCGLTKSEIRRLSKEAGLFTWDKPAYACLATRIPTGTAITKEQLERTEKAEDFLMQLGFSDFRVRSLDTAAKIQVRESQLPLLLQKRLQITQELKQYYSDVLLDLEVRHEQY